MDPKGQIDELAKAAGLRVVEGDGAPVVKIEEDMNAVAKRIGEIVSRLDLFELNGQIVYFDHLGKRQDMTGRIFRTWINDHVVMATGFRKDSGDPIPGSLDISDAATVLDNIHFKRGLRQLNGVNSVRLPVLRSSGELDRLPWGYDSQTAIYTVPGGIDYDTSIAIESAKVGLDRIDGEFPFACPRSVAVQRTAYLAMFCRHLPGGSGLRPGFLTLGNKAGVGKSMLAKAGIYPVIGSAASAKLKKDADLDKELEAFVRAGVPYIFLDNVYGGIASASLDQLLTSKRSTGRAMGGHSLFEAENRALVFVTGNRVDLNEDAARRFLVIDLFDTGDPAERVVSHRLDDDLMETKEWRQMMLGYFWAFVRHWHEQGMPKAKAVLRTYERYSELLGGIVTAAGFEEPFVPARIPDAISPDKAEFAELVTAVLGEMGDLKTKDFTIEDLARIARAAQIYQKQVGTAEEGRKLTIKDDGLGKEERGLAVDRGYLTREQRTSFGKKMAKEVGGEPRTIGGRQLQFGKREQARKSTFTVTVLA